MGRWLTDDGLWRNRLSASKQGCISYRSPDPLISQKTTSASSWQVLWDTQVCAPPRGQGSSTLTPLPAVGRWEQPAPQSGTAIPHICLFSGVLFPSPNSCPYCIISPAPKSLEMEKTRRWEAARGTAVGTGPSWTWPKRMEKDLYVHSLLHEC